MRRRFEASHATGHARSDGGHAFVPDPYERGRVEPAEIDVDDTAAAFAEELAEEYVTGATANVDITEQGDQVRVMELGGPYTTTFAREEIAVDEDASNPPEATKEAFPAPMRGSHHR